MYVFGVFSLTVLFPSFISALRDSSPTRVELAIATFIGCIEKRSSG
jgi:hypothetical protein